ncbi:hypothetical protein K461DRAFT_268486 [Myriangium duriaei CBS 260.36]|uniref:Uncharacterized protein n=1 Tax=Myriangium duriaei CBS 260.36 TaxID=1168546 RepID=A0A9P4J0S1_9PEZI|nr:hypothetical protein K461DRAFT_268486 [Myriangium duriaei CBS 260.36]
MSNLLEFLQSHEDAFKNPNRLASLYSDFHQRRQTNPEGYTANSTAWLSALNALSRAGQLPLSRSTSGHSHLAFTSGESLLRSLNSPRLGRPQALGAVINDALQSGALIPLDRFISADKSIYTRSWIPGPSQVVSWGLRALGFGGGTGGGDKLVAGDMVVLAAVESVAAQISQQLSAQQASAMPGLADQIYPRKLFESHFRNAIAVDQPLSSADFDVLLQYLSRDKPVLSYSADSVKLAPSGHAPEPITTQDESIANLRALIHGMTAQVDALQTRISILESEARTAVAAHQNARAKTVLRQKRAAEGTLDQRTKTLETLERTWHSIEAAADNVAIVAAMRESGDVLKRLNAQVGGAEGVDEVMERLRAEMDVTEDITQTVTEGSKVTDIDEGEVDEELEALERAEREKKEAVESAEREKREAVERAQREEEMRKRLEALDVPTTEPQPQSHREEEEDRFEEANENAA